jgi:gliding motility-associated-like protein
MKILTKIIGLLGVLMLFGMSANATHNRAGEITFRQIGDLTFEVTCTTYTKTSSVPADRDSLEFVWDDGTSQFVGRSNGNGQPMANDIKFNIYIATHTYPGRGQYKIMMTDPNRNAGVLNVNPPNSDQVPFHLETWLDILNPNFQGYNNSPILLQPPIDVAYRNQVYIHTPNAYDADGDSIAYELIVPLQATGTPVTNYSYPHAVPFVSHSFNEVTGEYIWTTPQICGEYNLAILIKEYRAGRLISTIIRDMQITVECLNNRPPVIEDLDDICVIAGETLTFAIRADDPDIGQRVNLTATGGPFVLTPSPAQLTGTNGYQLPIVTKQFTWVTTCDHIRRQPYQVVFKAQDDFQDSTGAVDLYVVQITVIAPPPEDVQATALSGKVTLTWESPYLCDDLSRFEGFSIWRREGSNPFPIDDCETGLAGRGYIKIADDWTTIDPNGSGRYYYLDEDVESARFYCYRVLAKFGDLNTAGFPANFVESIPSEEVCVQLSRDLPLITNVSVNATDNSTGQIEIRWSKPLATDLDTLQNPAPYTFTLYRSPDFDAATPVQIVQFTASAYWQLIDTTFIDNNLNTEGSPYSYEVEFSSNGGVLGTGREASSVFLSIVSTDQLNILSWEENVGWENLNYDIYVKMPGQTTFDSLTTVTEPPYNHLNLTNGLEYCYYIKSIGEYNIPGIADPLINFSQEACGIPVDTVPPCPPVLTVGNDCDINNPTTVSYINNLSWTNPNETCPLTNDVFDYRVYYAENPNAQFNLVTTLNGANDTTYAHDLSFTLAGCYYVTAIDTIGNESSPSNIVCKDNCPDYSLPNVFTPNNDGANDLFLPFPYRFIDRIEIQVFNRWGGLVFETNDPDINWDGTNVSGSDVAEGAYFYQCKVYELVNDSNAAPIVLEGFIQLIRG